GGPRAAEGECRAVTESLGSTAAQRGRPRNAGVDRAVIETVLRLLTQGVSFGELSMEGIAREAGVGKTTVYRRWPGKEALLIDVLEAVEVPLPEPSGRSLREDLVAAVEATRKRNLTKGESALMRNILAQVQSSPELWQRYRDTFVAPRRAAIVRILRRGIDRGEIRAELGADLDLLVDMLAGPVLYRATLRPEVLQVEGLAERVVDTFLDGVGSHGRSRRHG
ncbi:TetR/AcrR family transcriptional regulator, partial [Streptomyces sp. NPDC005827]|uniref:TetR/AcrR family transcriptional regulator n=1 Tax=Streptomyces sp. NPDC005827 TaxID=3157070 RepID=UPI0033E06344